MMAKTRMNIPEQKYFVGDLVIMTKDRWPSLKKGQVGVITLARCDKVCVKGGLSSMEGMPEGPKYAMEWCYVGRFGSDVPQGIRLNRLTPAEVIESNV